MKQITILLGAGLLSWFLGHSLGEWTSPYHPHRAATHHAAAYGAAQRGTASSAISAAPRAAAPARDAGAATPAVTTFALVPLEDILPQIADAHSLRVAAYFLDERSNIVTAMAADLAHDPNIQTVLTGQGEGYAVAANEALERDYPAFHVDTTSGPAHLKAIVIDRHLAFLGDRNFGRGTLTLQIPTRDVELINAAIDERADQGDGMMFRKDYALAQEAAAIGSARSTIDIESESFDSLSTVYSALEQAMARGVRVHLKVKAGEAHASALAELRSRGGGLFEGDQVNASDKLLVVDGSRVGWVGSTNASTTENGLGAQRDWGYTTTDASLISQLEARFTENL
jgi:hypothetical protein